MNVIAAIDLMLALIDRATVISALISKARAEGRDDLTAEELASVVAVTDRARSDLVAAIERAEAEGR